MPVLFVLPGICAAVLSAAVSFSSAVFPASAAVSGALSLSAAAVSVSGSFAAVSGSVGFFAHPILLLVLRALRSGILLPPAPYP